MCGAQSQPEFPVTPDDFGEANDEKDVTEQGGRDLGGPCPTNYLAIDPKGNTTVTSYDGASRALMVQEHLRQNGQGDQPPAYGDTLLPYGGGTIRSVTTAYDGNSRVTRLIDDNGNPTAYEYDSLDRQTEMVFPDAAKREYAYNKASNVTSYTDENGSVFSNTFDPLGRKTATSISLAAGVIGTTAQSFEYDGLSRSTFARDSISSTHADVNLRYDSLSRALEDSQTYDSNTRNSTNEKFTSFPVTQLAFPDGRQTTNEYDLLYRRTLLEETSGGADIASWEYYGPGRIAECTLGNGLICSYLNNARTRSAIQDGESTPSWGDDSSDRLGYDGAGRPITKRYLGSGINGSTHGYNDSQAVVGTTQEFDKSSNSYYLRMLQAESRSTLYEPRDANGNSTGGFDSLNRLTQYERGTLASGGASVSSAITLPGTNELREYTLDGLGNWRRLTTDPVGSSESTEVRQHNGVNQITKIASTGLSYDANGNLLDDGTIAGEWDAFNRLKQVYRTPSSPTLVAAYVYDALGRRIRKTISNGGLSGNLTNGSTDYVYLSMQCLEERNESNAATKQYDWGHYIDELIRVRYNIDTTPAEGYLLSDFLYNARGLTDGSGNFVEVYDTDAYGNTIVYDAAGTGSDWWADDASVNAAEPINDYIFTGRRIDVESGLYYFRARYYSPSEGRFISRDPLGYVDGMSLYRGYFAPSGVDPRGNQTIEDITGDDPWWSMEEEQAFEGPPWQNNQGGTWDPWNHRWEYDDFTKMRLYEDIWSFKQHELDTEFLKNLPSPGIAEFLISNSIKGICAANSLSVDTEITSIEWGVVPYLKEAVEVFFSERLPQTVRRKYGKNCAINLKCCPLFSFNLTWDFDFKTRVKNVPISRFFFFIFDAKFKVKGSASYQIGVCVSANCTCPDPVSVSVPMSWSFNLGEIDAKNL